MATSNPEPFRPDLLPGERIVWTGRPRPDMLFNRADIFLIPFSLVWFGGVMFGAVSVLRGAIDPVSVGIGLLFAVFGSYFVAGRFVHKRWIRQHTYYAVTDRRILVLTEGFRRSLQAQFIDAIPTVNKIVRRDGVGTIRFGNASPWRWWSDTGMEWMGSFWGQDTPTFYNIEGADRVYELVHRMRR
jgi:hypothetical protein